MRIVRITALITGMSAVCLTLTAPAFAGGKAAAGCGSGGYQLAAYVTADNVASFPGALVGDLVNVPGGSIVQRNHDGLGAGGVFETEGIDVVAIFQAVDKNGDGALCYKLPNGWTQGAAKQTDLLSLVDDKVTA